VNALPVIALLTVGVCLLSFSIGELVYSQKQSFFDALGAGFLTFVVLSIFAWFLISLLISKDDKPEPPPEPPRALTPEEIAEQRLKDLLDKNRGRSK